MKSAGVGALCFVLGVLLTLLLRGAPPPPPPAPACPPPTPCPTCTGAAPAPVAAAHPARPAARRAPPPEKALPDLPVDPEAHRERLRSWFEANGDRLVSCVGKGDPRRRLLLQIKIEADGTIADATLVGADDLPSTTVACVRNQVRALHAPREELRGRETLVVYVNL